MYEIMDTPEQVYKQLFDSVQRSRLFKDSKQFVDAVPKITPEEILSVYQKHREREDFDLKQFVLTYFDLPEEIQIVYEESKSRPVREHIEMLWDVLSQQADSSEEHLSLISLPKPYIVPGGRFREIYYWDSYFTMLGQAASGRVAMLESMVDNFSYLIDLLGFIPNGNRSYFCSRSQPPFFASMITLLADTKGDKSIYTRYLPQLEKEYLFWMDGEKKLHHDGDAYRRVVKVGNGFLNRYWDDVNRPRQESYNEDIELAKISTRNPEELYRNIRAACESGWDFTSRWFGDDHDIATVQACNIVPVDLNALMFYLEETLSTAYQFTNNSQCTEYYKQRAEIRKQNIQSLFFDNKAGFFCDLFLPDFKSSSVHSLAAMFPLFFNLPTTEQANAVALKIKNDFLKPGGWVTTLNYTGQQWDAPNGWAPLQWIVYKGLGNYGFDKQAEEGATRWVDNNLQIYKETGKLIEKYNVEQVGMLAEGGEYNVQHGFGWTNGVLLQLMNELGL